MDDNKDVSRREFLNHSAKTLVGVTALAQCGGMLAGCAKSTSSSGTTLTPDANGIVTLTFADYPNLESANGSYQIRVQTGRATIVINVHNISGTVRALTAICPHEGNLVNKWNGTNFTCPSHGSTFNASGAVTQDPAVTNLSSFSVTTSSSGVEIQVS